MSPLVKPSKCTGKILGFKGERIRYTNIKGEEVSVKGQMLLPTSKRSIKNRSQGLFKEVYPSLTIHSNELTAIFRDLNFQMQSQLPPNHVFSRVLYLTDLLGSLKLIRAT